MSISEPALALEVMRRTDVFDKSRFGYDATDMVSSLASHVTRMGNKVLCDKCSKQV